MDPARATRPKRWWEIIGVLMESAALFVGAASTYEFTYVNTHITRIFPSPSRYSSAQFLDFVALFLAGLGGVIFGVGWILRHRRTLGEPVATPPPQLRRESGRLAVGSVAVALFAAGSWLGAVLQLSLAEGWPVESSLGSIWFWGIAPPLLVGVSWLLAAVALLLAS